MTEPLPAAAPDDDLPDDDLLDALLSVAREAAAAAGSTALAWQRRLGDLQVQEKDGPADLVSEADHDAEQAVRTLLGARRPDDSVLGEEGGEHGEATSGVRWVVDPVDGTTNFLYGRADWAVSVAAVRAGDGVPLAGVVLEPVTGRETWARVGGGCWSGGARVTVSGVTELRHAMADLGLGRPPARLRAGALVEALVPRLRDVRRGGSAATALASVATGRVDACWSPTLQPWDAAAGVLLVREAGGVVGDLAGEVPDGVPADVLACGPALAGPLRALLQEVYADHPLR